MLENRWVSEQTDQGNGGSAPVLPRPVLTLLILCCCSALDVVPYTRQLWVRASLLE